MSLKRLLVYAFFSCAVQMNFSNNENHNMLFFVQTKCKISFDSFAIGQHNILHEFLIENVSFNVWMINWHICLFIYLHRNYRCFIYFSIHYTKIYKNRSHQHISTMFSVNSIEAIKFSRNVYITNKQWCVLSFIPNGFNLFFFFQLYGSDISTSIYFIRFNCIQLFWFKKQTNKQKLS